MVAGLEKVDAGRILIGNRDVTSEDARSRPTAMVFQNYALFPHMTVGENVGYGLRVRGIGGSTRADRIARSLVRVELEGMENRPVVQLSGGQQQRVALARALAVEPKVLLFDEPLSNLDVSLRDQTRRELKLLQSDLGITALYVTHDQQEALALSDRVAIIREGKIVQSDRPETVFNKPATAFVARFLGHNVVKTPEYVSRLTGQPIENEGEVLAIRPDKLEPCPPGASGSITARVVSRQFLGTFTEWLLESEAGMLRLWAEPEIALDETLSVRARKMRRIAPVDNEA
jgi:ABC-type Fe3+/spermidine/putrescine transport system ATPase subunit